MKPDGKYLIATIVGLAALAGLASTALTHGTENHGGGTGSGNPPATQPTPGNGHEGMMGNGMMGNGSMHGGTMGNGTAVPQPPCAETENSGSTPCGSPGSGNMTMPRGQMLPKTQ